MATHVRPRVQEDKSLSGTSYGLELILERYNNKYGERVSGLVVGELSRTDLYAIRVAIDKYLAAT